MLINESLEKVLFFTHQLQLRRNIIPIGNSVQMFYVILRENLEVDCPKKDFFDNQFSSYLRHNDDL